MSEEPYVFNSIIAVEEEGNRIVTYEEYRDLLTDPNETYDDGIYGVAFCLADGFVFVEGGMAWFLPGANMDDARLGTPLLEALTWDVVGHRCQSGDKHWWTLPTKTRADMEAELEVLKEAQAQIEYALAHDAGEDGEEPDE